MTRRPHDPDTDCARVALIITLLIVALIVRLTIDGPPPGVSW